MNQQVVIINLLRGLAAMMVCFYHFSNFSDQNGTLFERGGVMMEIGEYCGQGVYIFFVVTGFVIPYSLEKWSYTVKLFPFFLAKRFVRIEIPFLASVLLFFLVMFAFHLKLGWGFEFDLKQFLCNIFYLVPFTDYEWYNIIYWTLAVEFQFYILIGLFFFVLIGTKKWLTYLFLLVFMASSLFFQSEDNVFFFAPIFCMGILTFLYRQKHMKPAEFLVFNILAFGLTWYINGFWFIPVLCLASQALILYAAFESKISNFFHEISYSLYLIHGFVAGNLVFLFRDYFDFPYGNYLLLICMFILSVSGAWVFWWLAERPSKNWSKRMKR